MREEGGERMGGRREGGEIWEGREGLEGRNGRDSPYSLV